MGTFPASLSACIQNEEIENSMTAKAAEAFFHTIFVFFLLSNMLLHNSPAAEALSPAAASSSVLCRLRMAF